MEKKTVQSFFATFFDILIIFDLILIILSLPIPQIHLIDYSGFVRDYDLAICALLLIEFFYGLYKSDNRIEFTKENFLYLISAIPFDLFPIPSFLNVFRFLRLVRVFRVIRALNLVERFNLDKLFKKKYFDKFLLFILIIIVFFSVLLYLTDTQNIGESFYFVLITLTTVGYGDDAISTPLGRFISVFLILLGVLVFSTITGVISSFFTDRLMEDGVSVDENLHYVNQKLNFHENALDKSNKELEEIREELEKANKNSEELKKEISELKELLREK